MNKIILFLVRIGILYILSSFLSLSINFEDWNGLSKWLFIIIFCFTLNDMFIFKLKYFNLPKNVGTRPHNIQHRPKPMIKRESTLPETSKILDTKKTQSTSTNLDELAKLSAGISLLFISMSEDEKLDFLDIFLQVEHDNPYYKTFYQRFPDYKYDPEDSRDQLEILLNELEPHLGDDGKLIKFFKSFKSPMEILRLYTVYFCVKRDKVAKEKYFKYLYKLWEVEKKPHHYLYLIRYTKIKMLLHEEDYLEAGELIKQYNENLENNREFDYLPNLKQRIVDLM
ncbi:hypothetical protein SAMN05421813_1312 [Daejeonella rubra]|uniref:Uncharacterized protein n=1 Tax=Daejeonella rubra TaxID=990371 RepID=A0A1G9XJ59_9SPHI|nr:hypothetical protein [Daejeonella rubra]SDM96770.1 hypothetical protein SAMN05421813_1312 [Daejeonella rubra]